MPSAPRFRAPFRGYRSGLIWLYCALWVYPLFGQNWHRKHWYIVGGLGGTIRAEIGLRRYTVTTDCGVTEHVEGGNWGKDKIRDWCDKIHEFDGEHQLQEMYDIVCLHNQAFNMIRGCGSATLLYWTSLLVYVFLMGTMLSLIISAFLVLYFETGEPSKRWRWWCRGLYFFSIGCQLCLILMYTLFNFNMDDLYQPTNFFNYGKLLFNSPSNVWITASFTAWYALATVAVGFVMAWWTVLDLRTNDQLFDDLMTHQEKGLNPIEKDLLFGDLGQRMAYGSTGDVGATGQWDGAYPEQGGYAAQGYGQGYAQEGYGYADGAAQPGYPGQGYPAQGSYQGYGY